MSHKSELTVVPLLTEAGVKIDVAEPKKIVTYPQTHQSPTKPPSTNHTPNQGQDPIIIRYIARVSSHRTQSVELSLVPIVSDT